MPELRFAVLGGGLVGSYIARQLASQPHCHVTLVDRDGGVLSRCSQWPSVQCLQADLSSMEEVMEVVAPNDFVIGAVPGAIGLAVLEAVIRAGKPVVDISFSPEDPRALDALAKEHGVTAVVDCGVMPGLGGMVAMDFAQRLDEPQSLSIIVGGLPVERRWPMEYKAPFSPHDVIEEYLRPARYIRGGRLVVEEALSGVEHVELPGVDTLEAFNTDGLRTLLDTLPFPDMVEKTLRYPGTAEKIRMLRHLGFFGEEPLLVEGCRVRPLDLTAQLLFKEWRLEPGMREYTVMRVAAAGVRRGRRVELQCDLLDFTDDDGNFSMSRTTGLPALTAALALAQGKLEAGPGIVLPEQLARDKSTLAYLYNSLARHGIELSFTEHDLGKA